MHITFCWSSSSTPRSLQPLRMSLADELMNDLLSSDEEDDNVNLATIQEAPSDDEADAADVMMAIDDQDDKDKIKRRLSNSEDEISKVIIKEIVDLKKIARLIFSGAMDSVLHRIDEYGTATSRRRQVGKIEDDPEYGLVVEANSLSAELDEEILLVNKFIRDHYKPKFPELETLIRNPLDYAKTVNIIGNEMNIVKLDFTQVLTPASIMVVKTAATTTRGQPLPEQELTLILKACEMALNLDSAKRKIFDFVQSRISLFAPNVSAFIGTQTAAKLIGATGGLVRLSKTSGSNLPSIGAKRAFGTGFAASRSEGAHGFLFQSEFIQRTPYDYRKTAQRKAAAKIVLCARIDEEGSYPDGSKGTQFRQEIDQAMRKLQTPPEQRGPRALPAPLEPISKKRGGKRVRRLKEQNALTEMRKLQNRVKFGEQEEEIEFGDESEGLGMLTQSGSIRAFTEDVRTKARIGKKLQAKLAVYNSSGGTKTSLGKDTPSGLQSSLAFTPVQGIELVNPSLNDAVRESLVKRANDKWFQGGTFTQIRKEPAKMLPPPVPKK